MPWPKGRPRKQVKEEAEEEEEEMKKSSTPASAKKAKVAEVVSPEVMILNTKLETYMETFMEDGQRMPNEITGHLEEKIGKEKNSEVVTELHAHLEATLENRNSRVFEVNDSLNELSEITTIFPAQENMLLSMDRMNLKELEQFDGFLKLCMKKSEFVHLTSTKIHPEYEKEELIYTALCDFDENGTRDRYKASNNFRVRMAPRANSGIVRASSGSSSSSAGHGVGGGYDSQDTTV